MRHPPEIGDDLDNMFLAEDDLEKLDCIAGVMAMQLIDTRKPGPERLRAFHLLRQAAKTCPGAAYNLANFLSAEGPSRPLRFHMATDLLIRVAEQTQSRIQPSDGDGWPDSEYFLRDIASRALTDLGARISNSGNPHEAENYFRHAISLFRWNANAWVCYGNMGVFHSDKTVVGPLEGVEAWEKAAAMTGPGDPSDPHMPARLHLCSRVARALEMYDDEEVEGWMHQHLAPALRGGRTDLMQVGALVLEASDMEEACGKPWSSRSVTAAEIIGELLDQEDGPDWSLEEKVTIAASLLLSLLNMEKRSDEERHDVVRRALALCEPVQPLYPFLGDDEWQDLSPPRTLYLATEQARDVIGEVVEEIVQVIWKEASGIGSLDAVAALLFHLDPGFRRGVTSMVAPHIGRMRQKIAYLPALNIGSAD